MRRDHTIEGTSMTESELMSRRGSVNSIKDHRVEQAQLAQQMIEEEKELVEQEMYIINQIGKRKKIRTEFEEKFNEFRKEKQKIFQLSKENLYTQREENYLYNIYKKSKHKQGLHIYQNKVNNTNKFRHNLLKGNIDPRKQNLDDKVRQVRLDYQDVFDILDGQKNIEEKDKVAKIVERNNLTTTLFEDKHELIESPKNHNPFEKSFPFYEERQKRLGKFKRFSIDSKIEFAEQLLKIDDTGDYKDDFGIEDRSQGMLPFIQNCSLVKGSNFLYNESIFTDYRDITRYSRQRLMLRKDEEGKKEDLLSDFEWKDFMDHNNKNLSKRLNYLKFEDTMKINSGKISDKELNFLLNDPRKIKTDSEMDEFLQSILKDIKNKSHKNKEKKKTIQELKESKKKDDEIKKGIGSLMLFELSKRKTGMKFDDTQTTKFQSLFNRFMKGLKIKPRYEKKSQRESLRVLSNDSFMEMVKLGSGGELYEQIVTKIDQEIDERIKELLNKTDGDFNELSTIIHEMLETSGGDKEKLISFLKNYSAMNKKFEVAWMEKLDKENKTVKSVSEHFSPIKLRDFE